MPVTVRPFRPGAILALAAVLLLLAGPAGAEPAPPSAGPLRVRLEFDPSEFRIATGDGVTRWTLPGLLDAGPRAGCGAEALLIVALPPGQTAGDVRAIGHDAGTVARLSAGEMAGLSVLPAAFDAPVTLSTVVGTMRGVRLLVARVSPFQLDPATGELRLFRELEVEVVTRPEDGADDVVTPRPGSPGEARFRDRLRALVANPEALSSIEAEDSAVLASRRGSMSTLVPHAFAEPAWNDRFRPSVDGRPVDMVIVTGEALVEE
jgi:hypothetical protein